MKEYIDGEDAVPVCMEDDDKREDRFFADLDTDSNRTLQNSEDEDEEEFDLEPLPQKITKYKMP